MDKNQMRIAYEILGENVESISAKHNVSVQVIEYTIKTEGWKRLPVSKAFNDWSYSENPSEELNERVKEHGQLARVLRDSAIGPDIMAAEASILARVRSLINTVEKPAELRQLADIIQLLKPQVAKEEGQDAGLKVMVVNQFGSDTLAQPCGVHISENSMKVAGDAVEALPEGPTTIEVEV